MKAVSGVIFSLTITTSSNEKGSNWNGLCWSRTLINVTQVSGHVIPIKAVKHVFLTINLMGSEPQEILGFRFHIAQIRLGLQGLNEKENESEET